VLVDNKDEFRIKLKLYITHDLLMELLSLGQSVKVLQPQCLIDEIINVANNVFNQYKCAL